MCDAIGHPVRTLKRVRIGPIADRSLKLGAYRELTAEEVRRLKNAGKKPGDVILVGFDALPDEVTQIKAGWETASVAQFPAKIGRLGVDTLYKAARGKKVPKNVDTGTAMVIG